MTRLQEFLHFCELKLTGEQLSEFLRTYREAFLHQERELSSTAKIIYDDICNDPGMRDDAQKSLAAELESHERLRRQARAALNKLRTDGYHDRYSLDGDMNDIVSAIDTYRKNLKACIADLRAIAETKTGES